MNKDFKPHIAKTFCFESSTQTNKQTEKKLKNEEKANLSNGIASY